MIVTDGIQFYANTRDRQGDVEYAFKRFHRKKGIAPILTKVKHAQINEKVERRSRKFKNN
jgi:ribosomal protein S21